MGQANNLAKAMHSFLRHELTDPDELEDALHPIVGEFRVRPAKGVKFHSMLAAKPMKKLSIFTVRANSLDVNVEPPISFFGINIPLGRSLTVSQASRPHEFLFDINLTRPDRPINLKQGDNCRVLAVILDTKQIREFDARLNATDRPIENRMHSRLSIASPLSDALAGSIARLWSASPLAEHRTTPDIHTAELEDEVIMNFVLAAAGDTHMTDQPRIQAIPQSIDIAEAYLCAHLNDPISRADLADISGVCIRTLSRGFMKRHGMGPMQFLKARRLDAVYRELLGADPESTSVTRIALHYGFNHLSKFASDYRQTFHESPSVTLRT